MLGVLTNLITSTFIDQNASRLFTKGKIVLENKTALHLETYYDYQLSYFYSTTNTSFRALHYNSDGTLFGTADPDVNNFIGNYYYCQGPIRVKPKSSQATEVNYQILSYSNAMKDEADSKDETDLKCTYITILSDISKETTYESIEGNDGNQCFWIVSPEPQEVTISLDNLESPEKFYISRLIEKNGNQHFEIEEISKGKTFSATQSTTFFYFTKTKGKVEFRIKGSYVPEGKLKESKVETRFPLDKNYFYNPTNPCFVAPNNMSTKMPGDEYVEPSKTKEDDDEYDPNNRPNTETDGATSWWAICFYVIIGICSVIGFFFTGTCMCVTH